MGVTLNFDSTSVKPLDNNEAIPAGKYLAHITGSEAKPTNAGDGSYLALEFTILQGEFAGRKVFTNLNIGNKNPTAVEIAYRALSSICHAVGVIQVADSAQLHNIPLVIDVKVRPAQTAAESADGKVHDASNEIRNYKPANEMPAGNAAAAQPTFSAPPPATAPAAAAPAWQPPVVPVATTQPAPATPPAWQPPPAPTAQPVAMVQPAAPATAAPTPPWAQPK